MGKRLKKPYTGDIVNVADSMYLSGSVKDKDNNVSSKLELQVFDLDDRDKHFQLSYKDLKGIHWCIWVPYSLVTLRWEYNFWLKRKRLMELLKRPTRKEIRDNLLSEDKYGW